MVPVSQEIFIDVPFGKPDIIECDRPRWGGFARTIDNWNKPNDPCHPLCCFVKIMRLKEGFALPRAVRHLRDLPNTNTDNDEFMTSVKIKLESELTLALRSWRHNNQINGIIGDIDQNKHLLQMIISRMETIDCNFWQSYKCKLFHYKNRCLILFRSNGLSVVQNLTLALCSRHRVISGMLIRINFESGSMKRDWFIKIVTIGNNLGDYNKIL